MNELIFFVSLIILTIMHVIGDFVTPYRTLDKTSWKTILLSEYVIVGNILHGLWDAFSPLRRHPRYLEPILPTSHNQYGKFNIHLPEGVHAPSWYAQNCQFMTTSNKFWVWLGIDQAFHMLSNIFLAWLLAVIL